MERYTYFDGGKWRLKIGDTEYSGDWVDRLSAYEETGLEPEELAQAKKKGRLVVLPCDVEDTVYVIDPGDYEHEYKPYVRLKTVSELAIAHSPYSPPCGSVKETASVFGSVGAKAIDLQRPAIIQVTGNRATYDGYTDNILPVCAGDGELMADNRLMMPMMLLHKSVCLFKRHRAYFKHCFRPSSHPMRPRRLRGSEIRFFRRCSICIEPSCHNYLQQESGPILNLFFEWLSS